MKREIDDKYRSEYSIPLYFCIESSVDESEENDYVDEEIEKRTDNPVIYRLVNKYIVRTVKPCLVPVFSLQKPVIVVLFKHPLKVVGTPAEVRPLGYRPF